MKKVLISNIFWCMVLIFQPLFSASAYWNIHQISGMESNAHECSLALDSAGNPHIAFNHENSYADSDLKYATLVGSDWIIMTVNDKNIAGVGCSIAVNSSDEPLISHYTYDGQERRLELAHWTGSIWYQEIVDDRNALYPTSLALDSSDHPKIAYRRRSGGNNPRIIYASWDGSQWTHNEVDGLAYCASLVLDSNDNPHITFLRYNDLIYATGNGMTWTKEIVDNPVSDYSKITMSSDDIPHISYRRSSPAVIKHAFLDNSIWQTEEIDPSLKFIHDIAIDSNGYPHLCCRQYQDKEILLAYVQWTGSEWLIEILDNRPTGPVDLELTENDEPRICYYDSVNYTLHYAEFIPGPSPTPTTTPPTPTATPVSPWQNEDIGTGDGRVWTGSAYNQIMCVWENQDILNYKYFDGQTWSEEATITIAFTNAELFSNHANTMGLVVENQNNLYYCAWNSTTWAEPVLITGPVEEGYRVQMAPDGDISIIGCNIINEISHTFNPHGTCIRTKNYQSFDPTIWEWDPDTNLLTSQSIGIGGWSDPVSESGYESYPGYDIEWYSKECVATVYEQEVLLGIFDDLSVYFETEDTSNTHKLSTAYFHYAKDTYCKCIWDGSEYDCPDSDLKSISEEAKMIAGETLFSPRNDSEHFTDDFFGINSSNYIRLIRYFDSISIDAPGSECQAIFGSVQASSLNHEQFGGYLLAFNRTGTLEAYIADVNRTQWVRLDDAVFGLLDCTLDCLLYNDGYWIVYRNEENIGILSLNIAPFPTATPTATPTAMQTATPTCTPAYSAEVNVVMNKTVYHANEWFEVNLQIHNLSQYPLIYTGYMVLEVFGEFYFYPEWTKNVQGFDDNIPGQQMFTMPIVSFTLPSPLSVGGPYCFWGALLDRSQSFLVSNIDVCEFEFR
ncbi:BNR repeat-containing protein [bacterium]|nr:BNR repeat-containing protein [bacterium]